MKARGHCEQLEVADQVLQDMRLSGRSRGLWELDTRILRLRSEVSMAVGRLKLTDKSHRVA